MLGVPLSRYFTFFAIAGVGLGVDLWTKHVMFATLEPGKPYWLMEKVFGFQTALNHGALFGMGQGRSGLFSVLSVIAAGGIVYWLFVAKAAREWLLTIALSMITGGILGNLYDRLGLWGPDPATGATIYAVRDWILIAYGGYRLPWLGHESWPNFNVADMLLVCGAGVLVWHAFMGKDPTGDPSRPAKLAEKN